jgi:hypothetical protein
MARNKQRINKPSNADETHQFFAVVKTGEDDREVLFPVDSEAELRARGEELVGEAAEFHRKSLFIREITSPELLDELANDLAAECETGFQTTLAARFAIALLEKYFERLKDEINKAAVGDAVLNRPFLKRTATKEKHFLFKPPPEYGEKLIKICSDLIQPLFGSPTPGSSFNFWRRFAEWIWINQMTQAMEDLEDLIGANALEQLPTEDLYNRVLNVFADSEGAPQEFVCLSNWYIQRLADILASMPLPDDVSLRQFEFLIGLVDGPDERRVLVMGVKSLADQIEAVLLQPETIHQIEPRRFEELVAFGLERSGFDEVRLTPQTRDGGFDIEAFRYGPTRQRLLVECKRYAASRKVGRPTLDALLGVLHREKANQALLATTSSFSREALDLLKNEQWRLQGMELDDLLKFLRGLRLN